MSKVTFSARAELSVAEDESRASRILGMLTHWVVLATIFLLPIFFLPGTPDAVSLPKQLLLLVGTTIAGVLWLIRVFSSKAILLRKSFAYFPVILYVLAVAASTVFSLDRYVSFFGGSLGEYASLVTLLGFAMLLFLVTTSERDLNLARKLLTVFLCSSFILHLFMLLKFFGLRYPYLPADLGWNPVGSVFALGVFSAFAVLVAGGMMLFDRESHEDFLPGRSATILKVIAVLTGLSGLAYLMVIDWWVTWVTLLVGSGLLLAFIFIYAAAFRNIVHLILPLLSFILALLFIFIRTPVSLRLPAEVSPNQDVGLEVARETLREQPVFGSGPATYALQYAKHRPSRLNQTVIWNLRFDRAASAVLTQVATLGIVGSIFWALLVITVFGLVVRTVLRERDATAWLLTVAIFFPWVALVVVRFLYSSSMALELAFWLSTALLITSTSRSARLLTFSDSPRVLIGTSFGAVTFAVLMLIVLLLGASRYTAWLAFGDAVLAARAGKVDEVDRALARAVTIDPRTDTFWRNAAQIQLGRVSGSDGIEILRRRLDAAVAAARRAVAASPSNVTNWTMLASIYSQMTGPVRGAGELALGSYEKVRELEPRNPIYPTEMAKVRLVLVDSLRGQLEATRDEAVKAEAQSQISEHLAQALNLLSDALVMKQDYAPAHFYTAAALERQGRLKDALAKMEAVAANNPRDVGVAFQLALLYLKDRAVDKAEAQLVRATQLQPSYANAHWYLASIYEQRRDFDKAVREVEAVLVTNPNNEVAQKRLTQLKSGQSSAGLPEPVLETENEDELRSRRQ